VARDREQHLVGALELAGIERPYREIGGVRQSRKRLDAPTSFDGLGEKDPVEIS
jgi:hypothetical protein